MAMTVYGGGGLAAVVDPERGGKVVSLRSGSTEWLLQARGQSSIVEGDFIASGLSGWDECFPTIDACVLGDGTELPDHGAIWSRPWEESGRDWLTVDVAVPHVRFARRVVPTSDGLRFDYAVTELAGIAAELLWAAHPQFVAPPGSLVEADLAEVVEVYPPTRRPVSLAEVGRIDDVAPGEARKVYADVAARCTAVRLVRPDGVLGISWDPARVPHFGVWLDNGLYATEPVIALEPGIGWYDALDRAIGNGTALSLEPHASYSWWLDVTCGG